MPFTLQSASHPGEARPIGRSLRRGARLLCPACGLAGLFRSYLKPYDACPGCGEELHHHRADDAPPYFVILIVGHIVVPLALWLEMALSPSTTVQLAIWLPATALLALGLLPPTKGALIGLQWALRMHGFGAAEIAAPSAGATQPQRESTPDGPAGRR